MSAAGQTHTHTHVHHDHHDWGHAHHPTGAGAERRILWAMALTGGFMVAELIGGILSGSLALIADAGHMLTDVAALALAHAGIRFGRRPADPKRSYGYRRLEVLAAFVNGIVLLVLTVWITVEAVQRFMAPVPILSTTMLAIAALGLLVNLASFAILRGGTASVNVAGALAHVVGDLLGSLAAIAAALVILATGWTPIDPLLSLFVAALIVRSGWQIVRRAGHILLEGTPEGMDAAEIRDSLAGVPGVADAHHVHVWSLTSGSPIATLHLRLLPGAQAGAVLVSVKRQLAETFGITHSTVEIDPEDRCADQSAPRSSRSS
ncbi:MAG TPA: cation diffusion facilitator family transporter [Alphaproteobacteria bacterium]|nr:cation diffusion facilitator family transporter [Alphaproteobacteria bacterium]